jgi:hypothetical protein
MEYVVRSKWLVGGFVRSEILIEVACILFFNLLFYRTAETERLLLGKKFLAIGENSLHGTYEGD